MQSDASLREKLASALMSGVSTRNYERVIPEMAETCGVSKSSVSREFIEASAEQLRALAERRFDGLDLLVIYIDGVQFGGHHVIGAVGVDTHGRKHVLGLVEGATENAVVVKGLLESLVERGVRPDRRSRRGGMIDGSKALRAAIDAVFGSGNPIQRCRNHKVENVVGHLPQDLQDQVKTVMKAAYRLPADEGIAKLKQQASWLEREYPSAAASLLEGLEGTFTVNRLGLSVGLRRCLATTNIVESPTSGVRLRTRRVTNWQSGEMVLRWAAAALLETEKSFRKIMGYKDLWMLKAVLDEETITRQQATAA
jgi:transposase-like protein